jgi:hypothetical protein
MYSLRLSVSARSILQYVRNEALAVTDREDASEVRRSPAERLHSTRSPRATRKPHRARMRFVFWAFRSPP